MRISLGKVKKEMRSVCFDGNSLFLIDQRALPFKLGIVECRSAKQVALAIRSMVVRGAPAIGVAAAYGFV
ncbi:S-methyl-5-thioribose-1-phosphate isomerase, partial [Candidatus Micrarchaeota archaeon]